jgi:DNA polymerase III delta subunit
VPGTSRQTAPIAYFWGEDAFEIDRAIRSFGRQIGEAVGEPLDVWRSPADDDAGAESGGEPATGGAAKRRARVLDEATLRIATAPLFGAGTLVVIRQPGAITREKAAEQRLVDLVGSVPPGNALAFSDLVASGGRNPSAGERVTEAVQAAGGVVRQFPALTRERMEGWVEDRARDLGVRMDPGAARLLAERVGAFVRESDVDRRRQSALAFAELEKLAVYRPDGVVSRADVADLVAEAIPGSTWAFLDAVAARQGGDAAALAERLLSDGVALPVLVAQLHRRIRELISVREHLDSGARAGDLVRIMKLQPFRAQKLVDQARAWSVDELVAALEGLLDLDLQSKGISRDGSTVQMSDARDALELQVWVAGHAGRRHAP